MDMIDKLEAKVELYQQAWRDLNKEFSTVINQRDQLHKTLQDIMEWWDGDAELDDQFINAREVLEETEES